MGRGRARAAVRSPRRVVKVAPGPAVLRGNVRAAADLSRTLRSTVGPLGMEKMIVSKGTGRAVVTDDGQLILRAANIRHAAAKMVAGLGDAQAEECGDGVATAVLLVGELLERAEALVSAGVSQAAVARGYRIAADRVDRWILRDGAPLSLDDPEVRGVVRTALAGKVPAPWEEAFTEAIVTAARKLASRDGTKVTFRPGNVLLDVQPDAGPAPIEILSGLLVRATRIHPGMPSQVRDARVLLREGLLDVSRPRIKAELVLSSPEQIQAVRDHRASQLEALADELEALSVDVVVTDGWAPPELGSPLARRGILALPSVDRKVLRRLAQATGGTVVRPYAAATGKDLGRAGLVEECRVGQGKGTRFAECGRSEVVTLLLGRHLPGSLPVLDRAVHNALWALRAALDHGTSPGGGALEVSLARRLRRLAPRIDGREQLAVGAFADALESVPRALAGGMGADPLDVLVHLRAAHARPGGRGDAGVDVVRRSIAPMRPAGVLDARSVKAALIRRAAETAIQVLRVDGAIPARRRIREMKDRTIQTPYPQWMRTEEDVRALAELNVQMPRFRDMRSRVPRVKLEDVQ